MYKTYFNAINKLYGITHTSSSRRLRGIALSGLWLCVFLISACSGATILGGRTTSVAISTPTINLTLQNEGSMQLQVYQQWISLMQQYQGSVATYQQQYTNDQQALKSANSSTAYQAALHTLDTHVAAIQIPALQTESNYLFQKLQQQVTSYGKNHTYHDTYNNTTYPLGYQYGSNGASSPLWLQGEINGAKTEADYQQTIEDLNMDLSNFQAYVADASDKTPYNQAHQTDMQLLKHYGYLNQDVVVVSLAEQALRAYHNGKLMFSFQVTTGQPDLPTPPGTWWVEGKKSPTEFKSMEPMSSPFWYPPTKINYAMQFHSNGYFLHDSWWRSEYGPGTNFPHLDTGGTQYSLEGSHGCVNMSTDNAKTLYNFVKVYTNVMIY